MKFLVPFAVIATLLAGCESKTDVCAKWSAREYKNLETAKKLGLKEPEPSDYVLGRVCSYYKK